jgi:hypothetical protein
MRAMKLLWRVEKRCCVGGPKMIAHDILPLGLLVTLAFEGCMKRPADLEQSSLAGLRLTVGAASDNRSFSAIPFTFLYRT